MAFQSTVRNKMASAVVGDIAFDGPTRAQAMTVASGAETDNVFGRVFSFATDGNGDQYAVAGGSAADFIGIMINSKTQPNFAGIGPSFYVNNGVVAEFLGMGIVCVAIGTISTVGDVPKYLTATGEIVGVGAAGVGEAAIPNCKVVYSDSAQTANENGDYIAYIKLTN